MRRIGNLFEAVLERENLRAAAGKALRGKRDRAEVRRFTADLEANLARMAEQVRAGTFPLGRFHQFVVHDPKERIITAPCFAERVLHHALMNVCEPHFERWLIDDTYACRVARGRLAALARARQYAGRYGWFLKLDVRKYFDSVSHERLVEALGRRFKDARLLALLAGIVRSFRSRLGRGLPIGSLTSQHLANFYLGGLDRHVKEMLRVPGYVRYMDDMALWASERERLREALASVEEYLRDRLGLELKPWPYLNRTAHGMDFLGCRVFARHMTLNRRGRVRFRRRLADLEVQFARREMDERTLQERATALTAFTRTPGLSTWQFRRAVLQSRAEGGQKAPTG